MGYKLITRQEELLMLAIWKLNEDAYGMSIKEQVEKVTESKWSFGAVYAPLSRLLKKRLVTSTKADPTPERGGKSKVYYALSNDGIESLIKIKEVSQASWISITELEIRK